MTQQTDDFVFHLPSDAKPRKVIQWKYLFKKIFDYRWYLDKIYDIRVAKNLKRYFLKCKDYKNKRVILNACLCSYVFLCDDDNGNKEDMVVLYHKDTSSFLWKLITKTSAEMGFVME